MMTGQVGFVIRPTRKKRYNGVFAGNLRTKKWKFESMPTTGIPPNFKLGFYKFFLANYSIFQCPLKRVIPMWISTFIPHKKWGSPRESGTMNFPIWNVLYVTPAFLEIVDWRREKFRRDMKPVLISHQKSDFQSLKKRTLQSIRIAMKPIVFGLPNRWNQQVRLGNRDCIKPKFTAERDPTLVSYLGMMGEKNRQKLADAFPRPIRWGDYCSTYSPSRCTIAETAATRAPLDKAEGRHFFVPGLYDGFFAKTDKNDCAENPSTCTGHIADYPCGLYSPVSNQIFHLDLALEGDGYFNTFGYYLSELPEIWHAANRTKSNLLMYWTEPTVLSREYVGTDAEFTRGRVCS